MTYRPVILGIVGDSAAGKTTLTTGITAILGTDRVAILDLDDYLRYDRAQRRDYGITALHPDCNDLERMELHLSQLAAGEAILKPVYNHSRGEFVEPILVLPQPFLIVEGLLGFATPRLREQYHVKVFLDPPKDLRRQWKINRDCIWRGYTVDQVLAQIDGHTGDAADFIQPQRRWADMVVRFSTQDGSTDQERLNAQLILRPTLPYPDLSDVIAHSEQGYPVLHQRVGRDDGRLTEFLDIDGRITIEQATAIEAAIWSHLPELAPLQPKDLGHFLEGRQPRQSHTLGLTQLLVVYHLCTVRLENEQVYK
ncbi:MAG: phosphoribulokinase [Chloroflexales bacterium]|nr:phosphoribulokinase [Chloroflexales bacterium]